MKFEINNRFIEFEIKNRFTGDVVFTAEIDCADDTPMFIKLGLATQAAVNSYADLSAADLSHADLGDTDLKHADLRGADLSHANLRGADLSGANLSDTDLKHADLRGADLSHADLKHSDLRGADLSDTNLSDTKIHDEDEVVKRLLASVQRVRDGYTFFLWEMEQGPPKIRAGCRFLTIADYTSHVANEYPNAPKARETLRILRYFQDTVREELNDNGA